ncbi:MAG: bifunctional heptose 7-phosphate kinase/heptose 1-phosphate adenyltransferase [Bacteroidota bacterium]
MSQENYIREVFDAFQKQNILVIGDVMIDSYLWGRVDRISPEAPVPVVALHHRENRMGGAANVALNVQSLGAKPLLCASIGDDESGHNFLNLMGKQRLDTSAIITVPGRITTTKHRVIGNNMQMLRVDHETDQELDESLTHDLFSKIEQLVAQKQVDAILFEDYDKGVITPVLINKVVNLAQQQNIPVVVDPKKRNFMNYKGVTLLKPNLKELHEGLKTDQSLDTTEKLAAQIQLLQQKLGVQMVLATLSEKGVFYSEQTGNHQYNTGSVKAHIRSIADVSGAGDTVISIVAMCLAAGCSLPFTSALANLAGGLVCEKVGVVPVNKQELLREAIALL